MQDLNSDTMKMVPKRTQAAKTARESRLQEIAREQTETREKFKSEYAQRLLGLVIDALREDSNYVRVDHQDDVVTFDYYRWDYNARVSFPLTLTDGHNISIDRIMSDFEDIVLDIERKKQERIEAETKHAKKKAALSKLTEEERELLGL